MTDTPLKLTDVAMEVTDGPERLTVIDEVDLSVAAGELVTITGASGSGKSTLIAVAGLLRRPTRGRVVVAGDDLTDASDRRRTTARRDHIGLMFQASNLFPSLSAVEQLELAAHLAGGVSSTDRQRARDLLDQVGLADRLHHRPAQLSGGERQRVAVARALMGEPTVLLADEPTAALDEPRGREIMGLISDLTEHQQTATVIITHAPHTLGHVDRRLGLAEGRLIDHVP